MTMPTRSRDFPWRLLRKFLIQSIVLFIIVFSTVYFIFKYRILADLKKLFPAVGWDSFTNTVFIIVTASSLALFLGMMTYVYFELLAPLGVLFSRVKAIRDEKDEDDSDLYSISNFSI